MRRITGTLLALLFLMAALTTIKVRNDPLNQVFWCQTFPPNGNDYGYFPIEWKLPEATVVFIASDHVSRYGPASIPVSTVYLGDVDANQKVLTTGDCSPIPGDGRIYIAAGEPRQWDWKGKPSYRVEFYPLTDENKQLLANQFGDTGRPPSTNRIRWSTVPTTTYKLAGLWSASLLGLAAMVLTRRRTHDEATPLQAKELIEI